MTELGSHRWESGRIKRLAGLRDVEFVGGIFVYRDISDHLLFRYVTASALKVISASNVEFRLKREASLRSWLL